MSDKSSEPTKDDILVEIDYQIDVYAKAMKKPENQEPNFLWILQKRLERWKAIRKLIEGQKPRVTREQIEGWAELMRCGDITTYGNIIRWVCQELGVEVVDEG